MWRKIMAIRGDAKIITSGPEVRERLLAGAKEAYDAVAAAYGPVSGNVAIQKNYGPAKITHDGVSILREIFSADEIKDTGIGLLNQAAEKSNNVSGDGTSLTTILGYHIMEKANQRIAAGFNPMGLRRGIDKASLWIKEQLDDEATPVKDKELDRVAGISASDPEIGKIVADTVIKVGGIGITVEEWEGLGVIQDVVEGLYFERGWDLPHFVTDRTTEEAVHENASILVLEKKATQNQDIIPILEMIYRDTEHKTVLIVGNVTGQAAETCALTNLNGKVRICTVKPPVYGDQELPFLEDVAALTGAKVVQSSMPAEKVGQEFLGSAKKVVVSKNDTTILEGNGLKEDIDLRISDLQEQLKSDNYNAFQKERMEMRLAKLQGKIGRLRVGGATESEVKELKDRIEDAIHATRAARAEGIVPGGGTTLAQLSTDPIDDGADKDELEGVKVVLAALREPLIQLMINAGEDGKYKLRQVQAADKGFGFNVREMTEEPINLLEAGVLDPVKVVKSAVENACSAAGLAITVPVHVGFDREFQLEQLQINKLIQQ
jgi:chaperonin GroEL